MGRYHDFISKDEVHPQPEHITLGGAYQCQHGPEVVEFASYDRPNHKLRWTCEFGHISEINFEL